MIFLYIFSVAKANHAENQTVLPTEIQTLFTDEKFYPIEMFDPVAVLKSAANGKFQRFYKTSKFLVEGP